MPSSTRASEPAKFFREVGAERRRRARALAPEDRRASLVAATVPLLREHGREVTTRQIADAAGIAEGTIFRVFDHKDALIEAAIESALDIEPYVAELEALRPEGSLEDRLLAITQLMHRRFTSVFGLMARLGMMGPPESTRLRGAYWRERVADAQLAALGETADALTLPPGEALGLLRMLTFAGCNQHLSAGQLLTPEQVVDVVLHGIRKDS